MADESLKERLAAASSFILQSPPGEVNDVLNDVRPLIGDDAALRTGLLPALTQYNLEQFTVVDVPGTEVATIICQSAQLASPSTRFLHPRSQRTFEFDQFTLTASDVRSYKPPNEESEETRRALEEEVVKYVEDRYEDGVSAVFTVGEHVTETAGEHVTETVEVTKEPEEDSGEEKAVTEEETKMDVASESDKPEDEPMVDDDKPVVVAGTPSQQFRIHFVGNKYNPSNYWTGRWRSTYDVDYETGSIQGQICVHVHYYEQGNVQLSTTYKPSLSADVTGGKLEPSQILKLIEEAEQVYHTRINETYQDLGDKAFRQLRRALPITKQKMDWVKVGVYSLGAELAK